MKRFIVLLLFLQFSSSILSQDYILMAEANKYWFYKNYDYGVNGFISGIMIGIGNDTTIQGVNYKIVNSYSMAGGHDCQSPPCWSFDFPYRILNSAIFGYIREDTIKRQVYILPNSTGNLYCKDEEYLLFDFSPNIGDTINLCFNSQVIADSIGVIDSIGFETFKGKNRKVLYTTVRSGVEDWVFEDVSIYEGYGFTAYGWFPDFTDFDLILTSFCSGTLDECDIISSNVDTEKNQSIQVYPNPAFDKIEIKSKWQINNYVLYDLSGEKLGAGEFNNPIDISYLNSGIYFLELILDDGIITKKVVKINP